MTKRAVLYARVSTEEQAKGDAVSIDSQLNDMRAVCQRNGWQIHNTFVDCENYQASQQPKKGKVVSPSGERADRPRFLEMLEAVKSGAVDLVLCWRDDRLMRHPRVAVALEDALDLGDVARPGKGKITIHEATGGVIDRFTLSIKAVIWREENKRRVERIKMGKAGTLAAGLWPGSYDRFGYVARAVPGKRGRKIELGDPAEIETVANIFNWYDQGLTLHGIRTKLLASGAKQTGRRKQKHEWGIANISQILRAEDYAGVATWQFEDGPVSISIPAIVSHDQWERVQKRLKNGRKFSARKAGRVYILQHLTYCGECGGKISPALKRTNYYRTVDGELKQYKINPPQFTYRCVIAQAYPY